MSNSKNPAVEQVDDRLETALETILNAACESKDDTLELLAILRRLERLHQQIRDTLFQESLPDNRQSLYILLRDIETSGGWPYIYRPRLREFISHLSETNQSTDNQVDPSNSPPQPSNCGE